MHVKYFAKSWPRAQFCKYFSGLLGAPSAMCKLDARPSQLTVVSPPLGSLPAPALNQRRSVSPAPLE